MGQIRDRMEGDLRLRNYRERTVREYLRCAGKFAEHFGRSPHRLGREEVRSYLLGLKESGRMPGTLKVHFGALRFLYAVTLSRPEVVLSAQPLFQPGRHPPVVLDDQGSSSRSLRSDHDVSRQRTRSSSTTSPA